MANQKTAKARAVPLPEVGQVFLLPLDDGRFGACRVLRRSTPTDEKLLGAPSVLVVGCAWSGEAAPDLSEPLLQEVLRLTHGSWKGTTAASWVSGRVPRSIKLLGHIEPSASDRKIQRPGDSAGWAYFRQQAHLQWLCDHGKKKSVERPAEDVGRLRLHRFNGEEAFRLGPARILAVEADRGICLWLEASALANPLETLPDTKGLGAHPHAEVCIPLDDLDPHKLVGRRFSVPSGYDDEAEAYVATFFYVEQEALDKNRIEIVSRNGNVFHVRWSGATMDVNHYDGSKPATKVQIDGMFTFADMDDWEPASR